MLGVLVQQTSGRVQPVVFQACSVNAPDVFCSDDNKNQHTPLSDVCEVTYI